jgi:hypothetical protein
MDSPIAAAASALATGDALGALTGSSSHKFRSSQILFYPIQNGGTAEVAMTSLCVLDGRCCLPSYRRANTRTTPGSLPDRLLAVTTRPG